MEQFSQAVGAVDSPEIIIMRFWFAAQLFPESILSRAQPFPIRLLLPLKPLWSARKVHLESGKPSSELL